jgi:hypothetical protein
MMRSSFLWILCFGVAIAVAMFQPQPEPVEIVPERPDSSASTVFQSPGLVRALDTGEVWLRSLLTRSGEIVSSYVRVAASGE